MKVTMKTDDDKMLALREYLDCDVDDLDESTYGDHTYEHGSREYLVLTDDEADEAVAEYIRESVWAFSPWFLETHTPEGVAAEAIKSIQANGRCEDNNAVFLAMITDIDRLIEGAIGCDGRGHFLNHWDGSEEEAGDYFIYRIN